MRTTKTLSVIILLILSSTVALFGQTREKLGIAKPESAVLQNEEKETLWRALEVAVAKGSYELITRSDLQKMLDELQLQHWGNLVDKRGKLAKYHQLHAIKYVLVTNIGRLGTALDCSIKIVDVSTGTINPCFLVNVGADDVKDLKDKITAEIGTLFTAPRPLPSAETVILAPRISAGTNVSEAFVDKYFSLIERIGLAQKCETRSLENFSFGNDSRKDSLLKLGYEINAQAVVDTKISSYEVRRVERTIALSGGHVVYYEGGLEMVIRLYSTLSGKLLKTVEIDCVLPPRIASAAAADKYFMTQISQACKAAAFGAAFPVTKY